MSSSSRAARHKRAEGVIKFRTSFRNTIYDVMRKRGWKETDTESDWDFNWADREMVYEVFDNVHLESWQRINHFRNGRELCRKDLLIKNVKRTKRVHEKEGRPEEAAQYDFCPITFVLPGEYALFVEEFKRHPGAAWIMKPIGKAQGRGIFLFQKLSQISQWKTDYRWKPDNPSVETYVVQQYINNPYLVGGKKFDMRMYALVTSFQPLKVYLYRSGFARFSASRYSNAPSDILNTFVHLTNVAIQKGGEHYNSETGGKWDLRALKLHMLSRFGRTRTDRLFADMEAIMIRSLLAVQKIMINDKHCFELYGYDLLFDDNLRPFLIEVNASPSLTANTKADYDLKFKLLSDLLDVIDLENKLTGTEVRVGGFDLVYNNGPVKPVKQSIYSSLLGADFDRRLNVFKPAPASESSGGGSSSSGGRGSGSSSSKLTRKPSETSKGGNRPRASSGGGGGGGGGGARSSTAKSRR